jgi:hypothetical protein
VRCCPYGLAKGGFGGFFAEVPPAALIAASLIAASLRCRRLR